MESKLKCTVNYLQFVDCILYAAKQRLGCKFYFTSALITKSFRAIKINHKHLVKKARAYSQLPQSC